MKINTNEALKIAEKYESEVPIIYLSDIKSKSSLESLSISKDTLFEPLHYELLDNAGIKEIEVQYSEKLYAKLVSNFPGNYRLPTGRKNIIELDRIIDQLEMANAASKRKRSIISLCESYKKTSTGTVETILKYGEKLTYKRWNEVKVNLNRNILLDYRYDECGIIVFYILNASDPYYSQKFMKFTELVSMIVDCKQIGMSFYPDFVPETDVYTLNNKNDLLKLYSESNASLIIIGEDLDNNYKEALSQIKFYDRYARMMVIKNPEPSQRVEILTQIKNVYGKRLWEEK